MRSYDFCCAETKYTILVSPVTALVALHSPPAKHLEVLMTPVQAGNDLAPAIELGRISEDNAAAERH